MWREALRSRKTHVLLAVVVVYLGWQLWLTLAAPGKIASGFPAGAEKVNILVTLRSRRSGFMSSSFRRSDACPGHKITPLKFGE